MAPRLMLDRLLSVTTTYYCSACAYSTHHPELHPPRRCKNTGLLMHDERPDGHTSVSTKRTDREERTYPGPRNAGTRPRARNQAENRLVSFVDTPPRPPSTRRLGGDLFSLPAPKSPRQPTRPSCSHCGTLEIRHERLADADAPRRLHGWDDKSCTQVSHLQGRFFF